ncbi:MAG: multicopper oxidase domain-containing protein [Gammaproteobacteria bacterium]|nr:multicopper oxidase domain-containing protein [Gammaproteobacteria bacterium]
MPDRRQFLKASAAPKSIELAASKGQVVFGEDQEKATQVMYYNQSIPGSVIRIPQGRKSIIHLQNALDEPTSVHWHGLRIDNAMDGVPDVTQPPVMPGQQFEYRLTPPDAGTYWYHTHMRSWAQLGLGLAGVLIVEEENPPTVDQDLVFAIAVWRLDRGLQMDSVSLGSMHDWSHGGRLGNHITVTAKPSRASPSPAANASACGC